MINIHCRLAEQSIPLNFRRPRQHPGAGLYRLLDDVRPVLQVHDELVFEVKAEHLSAVRAVQHHPNNHYGWMGSLTSHPHALYLSIHPSIHPSVGCSHSEGLHGECCRAQCASVGEAEHRLQLGKPISDEPLCSSNSSASRGHSDDRTPSTLSLPGCHEQL